MAGDTPSKKRLIDSLAMPTNPQKMYVLVLGLCRTGTTSLREAFGIFGYKGHGMTEVFDDNHGKYWREALRLKFQPDDPANVGMEPYGPAEFRKLFAKYNVITDLPGVLFIDELRETFPDAKIVVSNRDVNSWKKSMSQTILKIMDWDSFEILGRIQGGDMQANVQTAWMSVTQVGGGERGVHRNIQRMADGYQKHYEILRQKIAADQRLEYKVSEGWEPLCKFVGLDIPDQPFPHVNDTTEFMGLFKGLWWTLFAFASAKAVVVGGALTYGGFAVYRHLQRT